MVFAAVDRAARPEIEFRRGEEGRFIDRSGNPRATEKGNSYPLVLCSLGPSALILRDSPKPVKASDIKIAEYKSDEERRR